MTTQTSTTTPAPSRVRGLHKGTAAHSANCMCIICKRRAAKLIEANGLGINPESITAALELAHNPSALKLSEELAKANATIERLDTQCGVLTRALEESRKTAQERESQISKIQILLPECRRKNMDHAFTENAIRNYVQGHQSLIKEVTGLKEKLNAQDVQISALHGALPTQWRPRDPQKLLSGIQGLVKGWEAQVAQTRAAEIERTRMETWSAEVSGAVKTAKAAYSELEDDYYDMEEAYLSARAGVERLCDVAAFTESGRVMGLLIVAITSAVISGAAAWMVGHFGFGGGK